MAALSLFLFTFPLDRHTDNCNAINMLLRRVAAWAPLRCSSAAVFSRSVSSPAASINSVSLVGVAHDIQQGFVFEDPVLQFTLTTTALHTTPETGNAECVVEKDHHVIRCFGELFSQDIHQKVKEGSVVCVSGRLRLNPQLEPSVNKYYYFPYIQVQPPHGQVAVVYADRANPPQAVDPAIPAAAPAAPAATEPAATSSTPSSPPPS